MTGRLLWIDILNSRVHTYDPATGRRTVRRTDQHVGAVKPRAGGGLVLNLRDGIGLLDPDDTFRWLHREVVPGRRANDAAVAPDGTLWAGTMRYDEAPGGGSLSRVTGDGTVEVLLGDVAVSNGTGWSPDGRLMYYVDSPTAVSTSSTSSRTRTPAPGKAGSRDAGPWPRSRTAPVSRTALCRRRGLRVGRPVGRRRGTPVHPVR